MSESSVDMATAQCRERRAYLRITGMGYLMNFDGNAHPAYLEACYELLNHTLAEEEKNDAGMLGFTIQATETEDDDGLTLPFDRARVMLGSYAYLADGVKRDDLAITYVEAVSDVVVRWVDEHGNNREKQLLEEVQEHIEDVPYYLNQAKALKIKLEENDSK